MNHDRSEHSLTRVHPSYTGGSLVNLAATITRHFGLDTGHAPLSAQLPLDDATTVILVIIDALGYRQLRHHLDAGELPVLGRLLASNEATLTSVTSTFPSTTATALTTLHTGTTPAEHGLLGFTIWLDDRQTVAHAIQYLDLFTGKPLEAPDALMTTPSLYQRLSETGMASRVIIPADIAGSSLSHWHFAGAEVLPYERLDQVPVIAADAMAVSPPRYLVIYWPDYDTTCHLHGPAGLEAGEAVRRFDATLGRLVGGLPRDDATVLLLTADHGQRKLAPSEAIVLNEDPELIAMLASPPMGERCAAYFRVLPGMAAAVAEHLTPIAEIVPMDKAWADGLFGDPRAGHAFRGRTGDLLAIPRDNRQLHWAFNDAGRGEIFRGGHGGWTDDEMLVPLIAIRR